MATRKNINISGVLNSIKLIVDKKIPIKHKIHRRVINHWWTSLWYVQYFNRNKPQLK